MSYELLSIRFNDFIHSLFSNVLYISLLSFIVINLILVLVLYLGYRYHNRIRSKILTYILNNVLINLLSNPFEKIMYFRLYTKDDDVNDHKRSSSLTKRNNIWDKKVFDSVNEFINMIIKTNDIYFGKIFFKFF